MLKTITLLFLLPLLLFSVESIDTIDIGNTHFTTVTETYREYGDRGTELKIYPQKGERDKLPLLALTSQYISGGCADKSIEEGTYEINGSKIILYSRWERSGTAEDAPKGDRIQVYRVDDNGSIVYESGKLYIELYTKRYDPESGMQYLFSVPKNKQEQEALRMYKKRVEDIYEGEFVQGKAAKALHGEVEEALMRKYRKLWH